MLKFAYLKMALEALEDKWDLTLNTDGGYGSVRDREKILKRHYIHTGLGGQNKKQEFYEALDAYLELRRVIDEIEASKMDDVAIHVSKLEPSLRGFL